MDGGPTTQTSHETHLERFDPREQRGKLIDAEHRGRYWWAAQTVAGKDVLDVACGTGYGSEILRAAGAATVTGVDVSPDAVQAATSRLGASEVVIQADLRELPLEDDSFDVAVCFETIEHVGEGARAVDELRRVLRSDGLLLVSSPNPDVYPAGNEHHVHEYRVAELADLLRAQFANLATYRQHPWLASVIEYTDRVADAASDSEEGRYGQIRAVEALGAGKETYGLVAASDAPLPGLQNLVVLGSMFEVRWWTEQLLKAKKMIAQAEECESETRDRLNEMSSALLEANQQLVQIPVLNQHVEELQEIVRSIEHSISWRITAPLRRLRRLAR